MTTDAHQENGKSRLRFDGAMLDERRRSSHPQRGRGALRHPAGNTGTAALALVADGMGGHAAGEVASALAAETIRRVFFEIKGPVPQVFASAFNAANQAILQWGEDHPECKGMEPPAPP